MEATQPISTLSEWRKGWATLLYATGAAGTGASLFTYTAGYFVKPIESALGWSRSEIAFGATLCMFAGALAMPVAGALTDRFGPKAVGAVGLGGYGLLCVLMALIPAQLPLYYATIVAIAVLFAATTAAVFARPVVAIFVRSRGAALAILMSGTVALLIPLAPLMQELISNLGWRAGYALLGGIALLIGLPCVLLMGRSAPAAAQQTGPATEGMSLVEALKSVKYWAMTIGILAMTTALGGFLHQLPALESDKGMTVIEVGLLGSVFVTMVLVGRLGSGVLLDLFYPPAVAFVVMLGGAIAAGLLMLPNPSVLMCAIAASLLGCAMGAIGNVCGFFTVRQFGMKSYSAIFGTMAMCTSMGIGLGALLFGKIHDMDGDYANALVVAALLLVLAGVLFLSLSTPKPPKAADASDALVGGEGALPRP